MVNHPLGAEQGRFCGSVQSADGSKRKQTEESAEKGAPPNYADTPTLKEGIVSRDVFEKQRCLFAFNAGRFDDTAEVSRLQHGIKSWCLLAVSDIGREGGRGWRGVGACREANDVGVMRAPKNSIFRDSGDGDAEQRIEVPQVGDRHREMAGQGEHVEEEGAAFDGVLYEWGPVRW